MAKLEHYRTPSLTRLIRHVLESPALVAAVRELPPAALGKLVDTIGLESAGELVALATTSQLERVFDEDLWREDAASDDPRFDPARFAVWLEVLLEAGEEAVVARLCELPLDFVILAVQRLVLVIDVDRLGVELSQDEEQLEQVEKALDASLCEEWEEFRLIARDHRAWDAVLTSLLALDREHHDVLRRILERCCAASSEYVDDNGGLYEVLTSDEMLESDARAERDDRRAASGYVAASDARSFLALARQGLGAAGERDPVTRAYFRELDRSQNVTTSRTPAPRGAATRRRASAEPALAELTGLLERAGAAFEPRPDAVVLAPNGPLLARALAALAETHPVIHAERIEELGYLANVLIAGAPQRGRRFRPVEALEMALSVCNAALTAELEAAGADCDAPEPAARLLLTRHLDQLFRAGFRARSGS
jgi:hypothetical protein